MTLGVEGALLDFDRWGREALSRLKRSPKWDLVILDLMLGGGVSGFDLFQQMRALPDHAHIPIIAVSASEAAVALPRARAMGFSGYISKPIQEEIFAGQIARIIAGEAIWHDGTPAVS
jgi:CheY-like chemotaxis protein